MYIKQYPQKYTSVYSILQYIANLTSIPANLPDHIIGS